jgi:hypothetical protein
LFGPSKHFLLFIKGASLLSCRLVNILPCEVGKAITNDLAAAVAFPHGDSRHVQQLALFYMEILALFSNWRCSPA